MTRKYKKNKKRKKKRKRKKLAQSILGISFTQTDAVLSKRMHLSSFRRGRSHLFGTDIGRELVQP